MIEIESIYPAIKERLMHDLRVDIPNSSHFGKLVHSIPKVKNGASMSTKKFKTLTTAVTQDEITAEISRAFDYAFTGETSFKCPQFDIPSDYQIGLIVGPSGSGKSTILSEIGKVEPPDWNPELSVASHFKTADEAQKRLSGVGFNSIPSWLRPYHVLSAGEKFRADTARIISDGACIDEFTSVVDRNVAKSCAFAVRRFITSEKINRVTFASCHYDIIEWLQPDWIIDLNGGKMLPRGSLRRPQRIVDLTPCDSNQWPLFSAHHYLTEDINRSARCWAATWDGRTVGFASALAFPQGNMKNAWREHRTVVLPDFQGLGIGVRISDAMATIFLREGCRFFSKTAHPRMGEYRNNSPLWRPTSKNMKARKDYNHNRKTKESAYKHLHMGRITYSHEFTGPK